MGQPVVPIPTKATLPPDAQAAVDRAMAAAKSDDPVEPFIDEDGNMRI